MTSVTILEVEATAKGDLAELILDPHIVPVVGMILMDEDSLTWQITGVLHDPSRVTEESHGRRWTLTCEGVSTDKPLHTGGFKLIH